MPGRIHRSDPCGLGPASLTLEDGTRCARTVAHRPWLGAHVHPGQSAAEYRRGWGAPTPAELLGQLHPARGSERTRPAAVAPLRWQAGLYRLHPVGPRSPDSVARTHLRFAPAPVSIQRT